jgi:hypothetical protein
MIFDKDSHPRGIGGRFTATLRSEPAISLAPEAGRRAWSDGLEIPAFRSGKRFTEYTNRGTPVRITAGVIDREARQVFTRGQCMALAVVLSQANVGTPVIAYVPGTTSMAHALVRIPGGALLDIDGVHDPVRIAKDYDLVDFDRDDFADQVDKAEGFAKWSDPPNYEMARTFVRALAEQTKTAVIGKSTHISG